MEHRTFGEWIKQTREALQLKACQCAERAGMTPQTWSRWETNENRRKTGGHSLPRPETLRAIAKGLGVDLEEVLAAAGITDAEALPGREGAFTRKIVSILDRLPAESRPKAQQTLVQIAENLVSYDSRA